MTKNFGEFVRKMIEKDPELAKEVDLESRASDICQEVYDSIDADLVSAIDKLFSLPNWERRIGPWNDVNEAIRCLHRVRENIKTIEGNRNADHV